MAEQLRVMISSTARDLPEHRKQIVEACLRQGMFPLRMEDLPANSDEAAKASLKMVEDADVYIGVFANRYGYTPKANNPDQVSVTEMEYNRAVEREIERLVFVMDKSHPITVDDVDIENAQKLKAFKDRVQTENIVRFFKSPDDLRAEAINSLSKLRQPDLTKFHYVSEIPSTPEAYIAHPYTLLQTHTLIGRQAELKLLTDWITGKELEADEHTAPADSVRIMSVVAMGGMGKSALTWKWFNDIAPQEMKNLAGRIWWSFYESDATFENFVIRALAYVSKRTIDEVTRIPAPERETLLLAALDQQPFLLVLDGLERIVIAYARMDAARLDDSEVGKEKNLRKTADPRVGSFLKKLAQVKQSRILASSRLYPAELETAGDDPIPGSFRVRIAGLSEEDAVELWRAFGVSGSRDELLPIFDTFAKHPLLIQALAAEVKIYRRAPGNFEEWRKANTRFEPAKFPDLSEAMAHVLEFSLRRLSFKSHRVLHTIAAFRMPTTYDTLTGLLVGKSKTRFELTTGKVITEGGKLFEEEKDLDAALTELEGRGLLGWDRRANRYDLHPIVRGVAWSGLGADARRGVYESLRTHFEAVPMIEDYQEVQRLEDLTPAIELYNTLIGLERYDDALMLFYNRLDQATHYRLGASRQRIEFLEMLFPDGLERPARLDSLSRQGFTLNALAPAYQFIGQPGRAASLFRRAKTTCIELKNEDNLRIALSNLSYALRVSGQLFEAEGAVGRALIINRTRGDRLDESVSLYVLGSTLAVRGHIRDSKIAFSRSLRINNVEGRSQSQGVVNCYLAQTALWLGAFHRARSCSDRAWHLADDRRLERDFIRAARMQGDAALALNDFSTADEKLHHALTRARAVNLIEDELPALVSLAEMRRRKKDEKAAREGLSDVWELAERGPYPLFHADALNVLAQIERDEGNTTAAIEAATKAYRLAWCDGPPFAYHWGLEKAKQHLKELGAPEPKMPPFDELKFEPMPEVEINPKDEFYVDEESGDSN